MSTETPTLTPTEELVLAVLGARHRLGEHLWTFSTRMRPAVRRLERRGLVTWKSGVTEHTVMVWLTDAGLREAISPSYTPPKVTLEHWGVQTRTRAGGPWGSVDDGRDLHRNGTGYTRGEALEEIDALQFNAERRNPGAGVVARLVTRDASQWRPST